MERYKIIKNSISKKAFKKISHVKCDEVELGGWSCRSICHTAAWMNDSATGSA